MESHLQQDPWLSHVLRRSLPIVATMFIQSPCPSEQSLHSPSCGQASIKGDGMQAILATRADEGAAERVMPHGLSAASWGAIFAGALVAVAGSLILLSLGAGFEFASVSPWVDRGVSATTFSVTTAIVSQWISA